MAEDLATPTPVWEQCEPASFEVDGERVLFPVWEEFDIEHGIRAVQREVPWVDGEAIDDTGTTGERFRVNAVFHNSVQQEDPIYGLAVPLYPNRLEELCALFRRRKIGTLNFLTRRNVRCKALRWVRRGRTDLVDGETLTVEFGVDNENRLDGPTTETVSVKVNLVRVLQDAEFEAERTGSWSSGWEDVTKLASQLDAAMSAPSEFRDDIRQKAHRVQAACDRVLASHSRNIEGRSGFLDCITYPARKGLEAVRDLAARADGESAEGRPRTITRTYPRDLTIWEIATAEHQDPGRLLYLNTAIEDPNWIPANTPVVLEVT
jgi:hypothetical protein